MSSKRILKRLDNLFDRIKLDEAGLPVEQAQEPQPMPTSQPPGIQPVIAGRQAPPPPSFHTKMLSPFTPIETDTIV
jgi:hypothetical protein